MLCAKCTVSFLAVFLLSQEQLSICYSNNTPLILMCNDVDEIT